MAPDRALRDLAVRYAAAADDGDAEAFAATFLPDATLRMFRPGDGDEPSVHLVGLHDLAGVPGRLAERYSATFHLVGQSTYDIEGDRARGSVYCLAHHLETTSQGGTDHVMHIRYTDSYERDESGDWRFATRTGRVAWTETHAVDRVPETAS